MSLGRLHRTAATLLALLWLNLASSAPAWADTGRGSAATAADGPANGRLLSAADLQADAAVLRRAYETLHPGLYRYRDKDRIDAAFAQLEREFARDRSLAEAYLAIARLTATVQCGHSYPNFFNQGKEVERVVLSRPRLPFEFRWLDRRMIVTRSYLATADLAPGTEVLAIDGHPVGEILDALLPYARADGGNDTKRLRDLEIQGRGQYEAFDVYFPLLFPRDHRQPFALQVRAADGSATRAVEVAAMDRAQRVTVQGTPRGTDNPWTYREVAPGVGLLVMPTWTLYNSSFDWKQYLSALVAELNARGTRDLVIDLRANEGGLSVGDHLLAHLIGQPLPAEPVVRKTRYRVVPDDLRPYLETWDKSFYDWGANAVDLGDGFFRLTQYDTAPEGNVVQPIAPRFAGRVWVLVGGVNSSATFEFASAVQRHRLGTLVGQPTGGNQRGITGGAFFFMRLPHSGIEVDVPLIGQFPVTQTPLPDAGLTPDVLVPTTAADIAAGRDPELAEVLGRIAATGAVHAPLPDFAVTDRLNPVDALPERETRWGDPHVTLSQITYATLPGFRPLRLDLYRARADTNTPRPLVVYLHGGGWANANPRAGAAFADFPGILAHLAQRGYVVAAVEYRLSGEAAFPAQLEDLQAALRFLRDNAARLGIDDGRVALWAFSAGAQFGALQAVNCPAGTCVQAFAGWFGPYDLPAYAQTASSEANLRKLFRCGEQPCAAATLQAASPIHQVGREPPPVLLVHGSDDMQVRPAQATSFAQSLRAAGGQADVLLIPGAGHGLIGASPTATRAALTQALTATFDFFDRALQPPATVTPSR
jgi:acetyl esterase/lipase